MSNAGNHDAGRRRFIAGSAAFAGMATAAGSVDAPLAALAGWKADGSSVLLHDPRRTPSPDILRRLAESGVHTIALEGDPVWFWRSARGAPLRDPATRLLGITGWAELLVLRGLAEETRRHLRHEQLAAPATFVWLIA